MAEFFLMPQASPTMESGRLLEWRTSVGATLSPQDVIAEVETDKAAMEIEVFDPAVVLKLLCNAGDMIVVDTPIAILGQSADEDITALLAEFEALQNKASTQTPKKEEAGSSDLPSKQEKVRAGPAARAAADALGVQLDKVQGTGPSGRIIRKDIEAAAVQKHPVTGSGIAHQTWDNRVLHDSIMEAPVSFVPDNAYPKRRGSNTSDQHGSGGTTVIQNTMMRKTIARRLKESYLDAPTFFLNATFDCDALVNFRTGLKNSGRKVSYNDLVVLAVAKSLVDVPGVNASWGEEAITQHHDVHVGVAVALEDGLITPVVRNTNTKGIFQISSEIKALADKAKSKKLQPEDYQGSTFTISNLGMMKIDHFTAIINPPNSAILAVGSLKETPTVRNGQLTSGWQMKVTMTCDHRVIDGALGAEFLLALRKYLECPALLVV